jgi:CO/xanthine dehydrogenase FAD-binding subunit
MVRNADLAHHPLIQRDYPVLSEALLAGASAQLRNKATTGGKHPLYVLSGRRHALQQARARLTWSLTSLRQKLGPRCHDVGERGQPRFRASRRVFWPMSLRAGLACLASAAASASMCAAPAFSAALSTAR